MPVTTPIEHPEGLYSGADGGPDPADVVATTSDLTIIEPAIGWRLVDVAELWRFRELLYFLIWRDVRVRYKQTVLGVAWAVLQPLLMTVVFSIFFGRVAQVSSGDVPYPLFAMAGLVPWTFFSTAMAAAGNSVVNSERLITKIYFPRLAVPFAAVGAAVVDFAIALGLLGLMMLYYKYPAGLGLVVLPLVFVLITLAAVGVGTLLAALNVAYRDFKYIIPFMVQLGLFATPTVYMQPKTGVGGSLHVLLALNPMTALIATFRASILGGPIDWGAFGLSSAFVAIVFVMGCLYFRKVEDSFADLI